MKQEEIELREVIKGTRILPGGDKRAISPFGAKVKYKGLEGSLTAAMFEDGMIQLWWSSPEEGVEIGGERVFWYDVFLMTEHVWVEGEEEAPAKIRVGIDRVTYELGNLGGVTDRYRQPGGLVKKAKIVEDWIREVEKLVRATGVIDEAEMEGIAWILAEKEREANSWRELLRHKLEKLGPKALLMSKNKEIREIGIREGRGGSVAAGEVPLARPKQAR